MKKVYVLHSGGLDSTTCLAMAVKDYGNENVCAVNIMYGQNNHVEIEAQKKICDFYNVERIELNLADCFLMNKSALIEQSNTNVPEISYKEQLESTGNLVTNVPFRNGLFISAIACLAAGRTDDEIDIYIGAQNSDCDYDGYPDCSVEFLDYMNKALQRGTKGQVSLKAPISSMTKTDVACKALELGVPIDMTWSCYNSGDKQCGRCASCRLREAAISEAKKILKK